MQTKFEHPIQCAAAVGIAYDIDRTALTRAFHRGALKAAAYRSKDVILIDTNHKDFQDWLEVHEQQPRVKGKRKLQRVSP